MGIFYGRVSSETTNPAKLVVLPWTAALQLEPDLGEVTTNLPSLHVDDGEQVAQIRGVD